MAALPFSFRNHGKTEASRFKAFHLGEIHSDVRQIRIKKVPHRMKQFTMKGMASGSLTGPGSSLTNQKG
jgi:hypothetical protein